MSQSEDEQLEAEDPTEPQMEADEGTYRFTGDHAISLESGQPIAPGEYVTFDNKGEANKNKRMFEEGKMISAEGHAPEPGATPKVEKEKGGS
jgi:hypothetical protein